MISPNREHEFDNGFGYEPDDRSVGIYGGFYHLRGDSEVCPADPAQRVSAERTEGEGGNRTRVTTMVLHCDECHEDSEPFEWTEWDPQMSEEDD